MKIILVRHGESESNARLTDDENSNLTKKGQMQAKHLGNSLRKQRISEIYTSTLHRAKQTADIISNIIKIPVKGNFDELSEYSREHIIFRLIRLFSPRVRRLKSLLKKISRERNEDKTILIVAHANVNRVIMSYLLGIPLRKQFFRFRQHNASMNILSWNEDYKNWALFSMNDITHLPKKLLDLEHETNIL